MNKLVNPLPDGGFPLETEDLLRWQTQVYAAMDTVFNAVSTSGFVINGCAVTNVDTTASTLSIGFGWVRIGGETRIFQGYTGSYPVYLVAKAPVYEQKQFFDGSVQNAYVDSLTQATTAQPGSGDYITFNPDTTARFQTQLLAPATTALAAEVTTRAQAVSNLQSQVTALQNETRVPIGAVISYSGNQTPAGWRICDGTLGTPDLRGRFIVGVDPSNPDYVIGTTGGEEKHTLQVSELPPHRHTTNAHYFAQGSTSYANGSSGDSSPKWNGGGVQTATIQDTGGYQAHENRPPYYALYYIQRYQ